MDSRYVTSVEVDVCVMLWCACTECQACRIGFKACRGGRTLFLLGVMLCHVVSRTYHMLCWAPMCTTFAICNVLVTSSLFLRGLCDRLIRIAMASRKCAWLWIRPCGIVLSLPCCCSCAARLRFDPVVRLVHGQFAQWIRAAMVGRAQLTQTASAVPVRLDTLGPLATSLFATA